MTIAADAATSRWRPFLAPRPSARSGAPVHAELVRGDDGDRRPRPCLGATARRGPGPPCGRRRPLDVQHRPFPTVFRALRGAVGVLFRRGAADLQPPRDVDVLRLHSNGLGNHPQRLSRVRIDPPRTARHRYRLCAVVARCRHGDRLRRPHPLHDVHPPKPHHRTDDRGVAAARGRRRSRGGERRLARPASRRRAFAADGPGPEPMCCGPARCRSP